jgi:ABC-type transport system involved in Fe-S cluster assembly fused permease/ATPase subunit
MTPGTLFSFVTATLMLYGPVRKLARIANLAQQTMPAAERIFEILALQPAVADAKDALTLTDFHEAIEFDHVWFRYEKYREEFALDEVVVAIDDTPIGTFVEIEGGDRGITEMAEALGRKPSDYLLDSYRSLFCEHCRQRGLPITDMVFDEDV